ncbi:MAG: hypothetical protein HQ581_27950 [Planctomycetes bacterium]|nr:hypothetical protein [Planctomycetota bacterium]
MNSLLLAAGESAARINYLWFSFPLVVAVSLVYAATRHEAMRPILRHALGCATWIVGFLAVVLLVIKMIESWWL